MDIDKILEMSDGEALLDANIIDLELALSPLELIDWYVVGETLTICWRYVGAEGEIRLDTKGAKPEQWLDAACDFAQYVKEDLKRYGMDL